MSDVPNGSGKDHVATRWLALAQKRLDHLLELRETGRWRLYHDELEFSTLLRDARVALKTWEQLAPPHASAPPKPPLDGSADGVSPEGDLGKT